MVHGLRLGMELVNAMGFEWFLGCRDLKMGREIWPGSGLMDLNTN